MALSSAKACRPVPYRRVRRSAAANETLTWKRWRGRAVKGRQPLERCRPTSAGPTTWKAKALRPCRAIGAGRGTYCWRRSGSVWGVGIPRLNGLLHRDLLRPAAVRARSCPPTEARRGVFFCVKSFAVDWLKLACWRVGHPSSSSQSAEVSQVIVIVCHTS